MNQQILNATNRPMVPIQSSNRGVLVLNVTAKPKIPTTSSEMSSQGVATLIVMCCVLAIIMMFCCFAAPGIRDLCKRYVFRHCTIDDPEMNNVWNRRHALETRPKIITEKQHRRPSRSSSERRQSRRHSSHPRPL